MHLTRHDADARRLARGCWLAARDAADLGARCAAALAVSADDTVVTSTTAARLHGLWLPDNLTDDIHLATATPGRAGHAMTRNRRPEFRVHRRQFDDRDRTRIGGIEVSTVATTWVDLAAIMAVPDLVAAGDSALRAGTQVAELIEVIDRRPRARGVRRARLALTLLDRRSRSRPESHLRVAATAPDLPRFEVNEAVYREEGGWLAEPDLSLAQAKIALEYQGSEHADPRRMRRDITRATDLRREKWVCLEFGPAQVFGRPWQIAPELRALIRERAPRLLLPRSRTPGPRVVT